MRRKFRTAGIDVLSLPRKHGRPPAAPGKQLPTRWGNNKRRSQKAEDFPATLFFACEGSHEVRNRTFGNPRVVQESHDFRSVVGCFPEACLSGLGVGGSYAAASECVNSGIGVRRSWVGHSVFVGGRSCGRFLPSLTFAAFLSGYCFMGPSVRGDMMGQIRGE